MGKKVAFTKGSNKVNFKNNPLTVKTNAQQKKPKAVKTHLKKLKATVTAQQESADKRLKDLHVQMAVKQTRTVELKKKKDKKPAADTSAVHTNLEKMQV